MYRARDQVENREWIRELQKAADRLDIGDAARVRAQDLFLSTTPANDRSKRAAVAASLYAGGLIEGDRRSQSAVADAVGVTRLTVQQRWKELLETAGLEPPRW